MQFAQGPATRPRYGCRGGIRIAAPVPSRPRTHVRQAIAPSQVWTWTQTVHAAQAIVKLIVRSTQTGLWG